MGRLRAALFIAVGSCSYSVGFGGFTTVHAFAPVTFTGRR